MSIQFRHVARALIRDGDRILIARMKGAHAFLPGGGIELGEGAQTALKREIKEELGVACDIIRFLGVIEFGIEEKHYHEINHLFEVKSTELSSNVSPPSLESHLEFFWLEPTLANLREQNVLPYLVQELIPRILRDNKPVWISNM